ncbi:MAG: phosphoribosylformylglycinamidine synthase subunit PurL [Promethearchaeota archaeon]
MENVHRIEVGVAIDNNVHADIRHDLNITTIRKVEKIKVYTIEGGNLSQDQLSTLGYSVFSDPITETFKVDNPLAKNFEGAIVEIGFKPGVTDNVGTTAIKAIQDAIHIKVDGVYTSEQYLLHNCDTTTAEFIAKNLLANELIQRWEIKSGQNMHEFTPAVPKVILDQKPEVHEINLNVSDEVLLDISRENVLALNLEEMKTIRNYFNERKEERQKLGLPSQPTDVELECLAQTWSEHCKHKIFNAKIDYFEEDHHEVIDSLFKTYIRASTEQINSPYLVSVFKDNAGVIQFNDDYTIAMKVETHNSPTALDPYGGALTGIVGCNRDPAGTGKGFKLIFNTDVFCFASPFYKGKIPPRLFHPRRVLKGVHKGVIDGGNQSGIPTVNGSLYFDPRYLGKPLVFVGTGGIAPAKINGKYTHEKAPQPGDYVVMCGGKIGADGIHGATFSSLEINENSPATAVQIGAPIVQKNMLDFLLEARDLDLFNAITDNGAGGLSSSVGEMGQEIGARLDLEKPPLKYPGLMPWEILVSEAQERMTLAVPPEKIEKFMELSKKYEVESTIVGEFNNTKHFQLYYQGKMVGNISMEFLHEGTPQKKMRGIWKPLSRKDPEFATPDSLSKMFYRILGRLNICSKEEAIVRRYDHEVQGGSIIKPFMGKNNDGPSDAAVIKPLFNSWEGLVVSHGLCPRYSDIDTYWMVANAIDEAVRNAVCVGADPNYLAGLDNFCWAMGFSTEDEESYTGQLVRANKALYDITTKFKVPCISGKDSMKNDYKIGNTQVSVPPTLLFSVIGKIPNIRKSISMDVKHEGDLIYILGITRHELGGSEYIDELQLKGFQSVPKVDAERAIDQYRKLHKAIKEGIICSAHDCSDGGLAVALAESAFAGDFGMEIDLDKIPTDFLLREDIILFSETPSRIILTIRPEDQEKFEAIMKNTTFSCVGTVKGHNLRILSTRENKLEILIDEPIEQLKEIWQSTLKVLVGGTD